MANWLTKVYNRNRDVAALRPDDRGTATAQGDDTWHCWDLEVFPGRYRVTRLGWESRAANYFVIGSVPLPDQVEPIAISDRFGLIVNMNPPYGKEHEPVDFDVTDADVRVLTPNQGGMLPPYHRIYNSKVIRFESWSERAPAHTPWPPNTNSWVAMRSNSWVGGWQQVGGQVVQATPFLPDGKSVSRIRYLPDGVVFSAEDSADDDFNDLVVMLVRIGD